MGSGHEATVEDLYRVPENGKAEIAEKRADYFAAGTLVVWDVDVLDAGLVRVYRSDNPLVPKICSRPERAEAEPALPGWSMPVADLFPS